MISKVQKTYIYSILIALCFSLPAKAGISARELGDSLTVYAQFPACVPHVKVSNLRVNKQTVTVRTNKTLSALSLSPDELKALRIQISNWVLGNPNGNVTIYSDNYELGKLITSRFQPRKDTYTLPAHEQLAYADRSWSAPDGFDNRNIALWPSHGLFFHRTLNTWRWQRARMWTMVEDLYSYEFVNTWLVPMLENAGAYVLEPRAREGWYYKKDSVWLWLGDKRIAPLGAEVRYLGHLNGQIARGDDSISSGRPQWMEGARYWLEYTGFPHEIWDKNDNKNDYKDDLQSRGLWVNYLCGGSRANPNKPGLGIRIDACLALHTDGITAAKDSDFIGTLAIYTDHDDDGRKAFPTGTSRIINRDLADFVQTQVVEDIRRQVAPNWTRRELNNAGYAESRYPIVPTVLLEVLSHKNLADMQLGLDPKFQFLFCRAIYKGLGKWMMGDKFVVQPLPVHGLSSTLKEHQCTIQWAETTDSIEPTAKAEYYIVYLRKQGEDWDKGTLVKGTSYRFTPSIGAHYDIRVVAGNKGGISMPSEILSIRDEIEGTSTLLINNFHRLDGPDWFIDSLRAGIVPGSYPVPYKESKTYLGDQWIYEKQRNIKDNGWKDDDNCGWGMCHMNYVGKTITGNPMAIPQFPEGAYITWSSESELLATDTTHYTSIELFCGQERGTLYPAPLRQFIESQIQRGTTLTIRGKYLGSGIDDTTERKWAEQILGYKLTAPKATVAEGKTNAPDAIHATKQGTILRRFEDTGLPSELLIEKGNSKIHLICE